MKCLEKIILVQYFVCEAEEIELRGHTAFLGPNGTGKSALLDAIQIAMMGADLSHIRFNVKSAVKDMRSLRDYCLGFYRPPEASESASTRPLRCRDTAHTYITLVFHDEQTGERVSAGVAINASIRDERHRVRGHYVARGIALSLDDHLQAIGNGTAPLPWNDFEVALRERCAREGITNGIVHEGAHAYVRELLHALQPANVVIHPDEFRKAFKKSLALRDMENVSDLVRTFVIDEQSIDRQRATAEINRFRELERLVQETELEVAELTECEGHYKRLEDAARRRATYQALGHILEVERLQERIADVQDEIEKLEREGGGALEALRALGDAKQLAQDRVVHHRDLMRATETTQDLKAKYDLLAQAKRGAGNVDARYRAILTKQFAVISNAKSYADVCESLRAELKALESRYTRRQEQSSAIGADESPALIEEAAHLLRRTHAALKRVFDRVSTDSAAAETAVSEIRQQIAHAESGGGRIDRRVSGALMTLHKANLDARPVSDLVRVRESEWQPAIEAYLARNRFSLLLPDAESERQAVRIARDPSARLAGSKIIRVGHIPNEFYADPSPDMVSSLLESDDRDAIAYLRMQCGGLRKMHSDTDLDDVHKGLSVDGLLNKGASSQPLEMPSPGELALGRTASPEDLTALRAELGDWERKANEKGRYKDQLELLIGRCVPVSDVTLLGDEMRGISEQGAKAEKEIAGIKSSIDALESGEAGDLGRLLATLEREAREAERLWDEAAGASATRKATLDQRRGERDRLEALAVAAQEDEQRSRQTEDYDEAHAYEMRESLEGKFLATPETERLSEMLRLCAERARVQLEQRARLSEEARRKFFEFLQVRRHDALELLEDWRKAKAWIALRKQLLIDTTLIEHRDLAANARSAAEDAFRKDVVYKLRDGIARMKQTIQQINKILKGCPEFSNGESYRFSAQPASIYKDLHDYIVNAGTRDQGDMFNENTEIAGRIMEYLVPGDGAPPLAVNPLEDFRLMFDFDLDIYADGVKISSLSRRMGRGSNGEHLCPFHVIVAVSLHHAYRLDQSRGSGGLCLMMLDEAFSAMDEQNALAAAKFITNLDLQLVMAGPSADCGKLSAFTRTIYELDRWDGTLEFHREELTDQAHALLQSDMPDMNPDLVQARADGIRYASP